MELGIFMEGYVREGSSPDQRLRELVKEAIRADEVGLHSFAVSEQHFKHPTNSTSAPEVLLAAVAQATKQIRIQPSVAVLPLHNPIQLAERWATVDILSDGRLDMGIGRGNTPLTADAFKVPILETEDRTIEGLGAILNAWSDGASEWTGEYYSAPAVDVTPKPSTKPHPPLYWAATSPHAHERGGELGLGLLTSANALDLEQVRRRVEDYRRGRQHREPLSPGQADNGRVIVMVLGHCAETGEEAQHQAGRFIVEYVNRTVEMYKVMVERSGKSGVDFSRSERFKDNLPALMDAGTVVIGAPEDCIAQLRRIKEELDPDEVVIRLDGPSHDELMRCIELLGKEVAPALRC